VGSAITPTGRHVEVRSIADSPDRRALWADGWHGAGALTAEGQDAGGLMNPMIQRLALENALLREQFNDAHARLQRLEDEKSRWMDEGVFDLANTLCHSSVVDLRGSARQASLSDPSPELPSPLLLDLSPVSALSTKLRRGVEQKRSSELMRENEELRQELAEASTMGETLETQQKQAEERMLQLEQEQAWLIERFAEREED
ncbi:unnamed protein product, partial [Prorocentrum cordatum]